MPHPDMTVHTVTLDPGSSEYQNIMSKFQATGGGVQIQKIERVQNPHLYKQYMVQKQKMDKDNGENNELQLFHGTEAKNICAINTQGFNKNFCGVNGKCFFARGVGKKSSFSLIYSPKSRRKKKLRLKIFGLFLFKGFFILVFKIFRLFNMWFLLTRLSW